MIPLALGPGLSYASAMMVRRMDLQLRRAAALGTAMALAACVPPDFPENPFKRTERDAQTAPRIEPVETGFPDREDQEAAQQLFQETLSLREQADGLTERTTALTDRDPAVSGDLVAPSPPADEVRERQQVLRERAEALRMRQDVGQPAERDALENRRLKIDEEAEILRTRED